MLHTSIEMPQLNSLPIIFAFGECVIILNFVRTSHFLELFKPFGMIILAIEVKNVDFQIQSVCFLILKTLLSRWRVNKRNFDRVKLRSFAP